MVGSKRILRSYTSIQVTMSPSPHGRVETKAEKVEWAKILLSPSPHGRVETQHGGVIWDVIGEWSPSPHGRVETQFEQKTHMPQVSSPSPHGRVETPHSDPMSQSARRSPSPHGRVETDMIRDSYTDDPEFAVPSWSGRNTTCEILQL